MQKLISKIALASVITVFSLTGHAGSFYEKDGVAINGYDSVAYFDSNKALRGSDAHTAVYKGSTFHFATPRNRDLFVANPGRYAPQYDGFCAYGVAKGARAKTEGEAFKIVDGKLYLNYNKAVQADWEVNQAKLIKKANKNWGTVRELTAVVR